MPRYLNGINISSLTLGDGSGGSLTTGDNNCLLGANAGAGLTTGSHNTLIGAYPAATEPDLQDSVVLSNGRGTAVCRWDGQGTVEQTVGPLSALADPTTDGTARLAFDPDYNALVHRVRYGGVTHTSYGATKESVDALGVTAADSLMLGGVAAADFLLAADAQLATSGTGTTLIDDVAPLTLRGITADTGLTVDASDPRVVRLVGTVTTLQDDTTDGAGIPAGAQTVIGTGSAGAALRTKRIVAGNGISLAASGSTLTIENTQTSAGVTLASEGPADSVSLVSDGVGPTLGVRGLRAGTGITVTEEEAQKQVVVASGVTLASEAGGSSLVSVGTGAALTTKYLAAGTGIALTANGTTGLTVSSTVPTTTLASATASGVGLVVGGTAPSLTVKAIAGGYATGLVEDVSNVITVRSHGVVTVPVRPADVVATNGQLRLVPLGIAMSPSGWPVDADLLPFRLPALCYKASGGVASHKGTMVCAVPGLPRNALELGFHLDVSLYAPGTAGFTWDVQAVLPCPNGATPAAWDYFEFTGTLTAPAFTAGTPPPATVEVLLTPTVATKNGKSATLVCVDGSTLPRFPRLGGQDLNTSPDLLILRWSATTALAFDVNVLGMRLTLVPNVAISTNTNNAV